MNKLTGLFLVSILTALCLGGCGPSQHDAFEYNDAIIREQRAIDSTERVMIAALEDSTAIEPAYEAYMKQVEISLLRINALSDFDERSGLKNAALKLVTAYRNVGTSEYKEIVSIMKRSDDRITAEDKERVNKLLEEVNRKLSAELAEFNKAQESFAMQFGIQIEEAKGKK